MASADNAAPSFNADNTDRNATNDTGDPVGQDVESLLIEALRDREASSAAAATKSPDLTFDAFVPMAPFEQSQFGIPGHQAAPSEPIDVGNGNIVESSPMPQMELLMSSCQPNLVPSSFRVDGEEPIVFDLPEWTDSKGLAPSGNFEEALAPAAPPAPEQPTTHFHPAQALISFVTTPAYGPESRESSLPPHGFGRFSVALNPRFANFGAGRRRSQSVPPQMEFSFHRRDVKTGNMRHIKSPLLPPAMPRSAVQDVIDSIPDGRPTHPHAAPTLLNSSYPIAVPPIHQFPAGMMTEPSSPVPYLTPHSRNIYKRPLDGYEDDELYRGRAKPGPKRRGRQKKTPSPAGKAIPPHSDLWDTEALLESIRSLVGQKLDEVHGVAAGSELETYADRRAGVLNLQEPRH